MAMTGAAASLLFAGIVAALMVGSAPAVSLVARPLITAKHLMRSTVWLSAILGLLHLVPAYPLDAGRVLRGRFARTRGAAQATKAASSVGQGFGAFTMIAGLALLALPNNGVAAGLGPWLIMGGFFIFIGAQLEDQGVVFQSVVETVRMRDVMLTEFSTMSPSDTLADALFKAIHSLQDEFPVVRGANLVDRLAAGDFSGVAQRRERIRAVDHVALISGGRTRRFAGAHDSAHPPEAVCRWCRLRNRGASLAL